jgi:AcrR family transcriptional regulator
MTSPGGPPRQLRADAQRNRERLLAAAREVFAERGVDVPLEEIARRAGVSIGTLYNRFPARSDLIEAVFTDRLEKLAALARQALAAADPWDGFAAYLTGIGELQAADRGFNEVAARDALARSPAAQQLVAEAQAAVSQIMSQAQRAGELRGDVTIDDLAFVVWGISRTVEMTAGSAPQLWRRHLALLLDGFRAAGAHHLPVQPRRGHGPHSSPHPPPGDVRLRRT